MATKLNFALLMIIPLFVLPDVRKKVQFIIATVLSFVFWTWPILPQYKNLFNWYYKIIIHKGYYGLGDPGMVDVNTYFYNLMYLFSGEPVNFMILLISLFFVIKMIRSSADRKIIRQDICFRILCGVVVMQISAYVLFAKHAADRYLIPAVCLSGFMLFLIAMCLKRFNGWDFIDVRKKLSLSLVILFLVFVSGWRIFDLKNIFDQKTQIKKESLMVNRILETDFKNYIKIAYNIPSFGASSAPAALAFGNFFIADGLYSDLLQEIYKDFYFFDSSNGRFYSWTREFSCDEIISKGLKKGLIFYGPPLRFCGDKLICFHRAVSPQGMRELSVETLIYKAVNHRKALRCSPLNDAIDKSECGDYRILSLKDIFGGEYQTIYSYEY